MKDIWKVAFGLVCGFLGAGLIILASSSPRGNAITLSPPPSPEPIQVFVTGAVVNPGLYKLAANSRVGDAIQAAGGFSTQAYSQTLNLAALMHDGERIFVPFQPTEIPADDTSRSRSIEVQTIDPYQQININTANQSELELLPGIGPAIAQRIIEYRESNGPFSNIEDIEKVSGIGPAKFDAIKELITVEISR